MNYRTINSRFRRLVIASTQLSMAIDDRDVGRALQHAHKVATLAQEIEQDLGGKSDADWLAEVVAVAARSGPTCTGNAAGPVLVRPEIREGQVRA